MNIENKQYRKELMEKFLDAQTSLDEEMALYSFYSKNQADEDEQAEALLFVSLYSMPELHTEREEEFDSIVQGQQRKSRWRGWSVAASIIAAAVIALFVIVNFNHNSTPEISDNDDSTIEFDYMALLSTIADLDDVNAIKAETIGESSYIKAQLKDGQEMTYLIMEDNQYGGLCLVAINSNKNTYK